MSSRDVVYSTLQNTERQSGKFDQKGRLAVRSRSTLNIVPRSLKYTLLHAKGTVETVVGLSQRMTR